MPSKLDLLKTLSKEQLEKAAASQGIKLPKGSTKKEIITKLSKLPMSKIKEIVEKYGKEGKEKSKRREKKVDKKEKRAETLRSYKKTTRTTAYNDAESLINKFIELGIKIHPALIKELGARFSFQPKLKGDLRDVYGSFNVEALKFIYESFIERKTSSPLHLIFRVAQWVSKKYKDVSRIDVNKEISGIGIISIIFYNSKGKVLSIADCIDKQCRISVEDVDRWLEKIKKLYHKSKGSLKDAYLISAWGFTPDVRVHLMEKAEINERGFLKIRRSLIRIADGEIIIGAKEGVNVFLCEEKLGEIMQVFP